MIPATWTRTVPTFGLDIGSSAIKVVELRKKRGRYGLSAFAMLELPRDAIADGYVKQPDVVVEVIRECVRVAGVTHTTAAISVAGRDSIVKRVLLPKVRRQELRDAVTFEAEHHIPFAIEDVFLDYQVTATSATSTSILLVATKRGKVLEYVSLVEQAGFEAAVVDLDAFAIQNQYAINAEAADTEPVALIDIGASVMKTNVVHRGTSMFARDVALGGHAYTDAIAQQFDLPTSRAEAAKRGQDPDVSREDLRPALDATSREIGLEVRRTFDYIASTGECERIGKIVLSGGCAMLVGLDTALARETGVPVELARPLAHVQHEAGAGSPPDVQSVQSQLAVAVGVALRRPGDKRA